MNPKSFSTIVSPPSALLLSVAVVLILLQHKTEGQGGVGTLSSVRESLIRQEDTIVFSLIERAQHPFNLPTYVPNPPQFEGASILEFLGKETETIQAKLGRFAAPEEKAFFADQLPEPLLKSDINYTQVLHPAAARVNINNRIRKMYLQELLALFTAKGDNGKYVNTAASDLACLQALSRRIHYGMFVAESKFREAPQAYGVAIRAQDRDTLMRLLTDKKVEEMVKTRVANKAAVYEQEIGSNSTSGGGGGGRQKIDPSVASLLYEKWVIPFTKLVEVEYLLQRLD